MTTRVWLDSRRALLLFGAAILTFGLPVFSMPAAMAWVAQPETNRMCANAAEITPRGRAATQSAGAVVVGQQNSSTVGSVQIRLADEIHERQRELFDPHDSFLDERRYYPGHGYDIPWDRDPLFGQTRQPLATTSLVGGCARCPSRNDLGTRKRVGQTKKHSPAAPTVRSNAPTLPLDLPPYTRVRL